MKGNQGYSFLAVVGGIPLAEQNLEATFALRLDQKLIAVYPRVPALAGHIDRPVIPAAPSCRHRVPRLTASHPSQLPSPALELHKRQRKGSFHKTNTASCMHSSSPLPVVSKTTS